MGEVTSTYGSGFRQSVPANKEKHRTRAYEALGRLLDELLERDYSGNAQLELVIKEGGVIDAFGHYKRKL